MFSNNYFTISDFAKLMGISRQTLIYYDRIGLFKPVKTLDNRYRLYARSQINVISLITMLGEMGVPLKKIKAIVDSISPDTAIAILNRQREEAEEKLQRFRMLEGMIRHRIEQIASGKDVPEKAPPFSVREVPEDIPLYLGEKINAPLNGIADDCIIDFYSGCEKRNFPLIFSSGQMKSRENLLAGRTDIVSCLCFTLKDAAGANAVLPRGLYAVGYMRGDYGNTDTVYRALFSFIQENNLQIIGNAYEEYLLDELAESDPNRFLLQLMVQVGRSPDAKKAGDA